jgi:uncharacterized repeat protein (TIGR04052 family)
MKITVILLLASVLANITLAQQDITINFALKAGDTDVACAQKVALGTTQHDSELLDARAYISELHVVTESGEEIPVSLTQDGVWQYENVALIDFENATGACQGTPETNTQIVGQVDTTDAITGIAFTVGVPEELNHLDSAIATSPLNVTDMWWTWLFGYKFMRVDLMTNSMPMAMTEETSTEEASTTETTSTDTSAETAGSEGAGHGGGSDNAWVIHLGSTDCVGEDFVFPPDESCSNPNRIEVKLDMDVATNTVVLDLEQLLSTTDVSRSLKLEPPGCMSDPSDPDCSELFTAGFGLSLEDGQPLGESPAFFRVE